MHRPTCDWLCDHPTGGSDTQHHDQVDLWQKVEDLKHLLGGDTDTEEGKTILQEWKKLTLYQGALYHWHALTGELEGVLQFVVPKVHWVDVMNGCH